MEKKRQIGNSAAMMYGVLAVGFLAICAGGFRLLSGGKKTASVPPAIAAVSAPELPPSTVETLLPLRPEEQAEPEPPAETETAEAMEEEPEPAAPVQAVQPMPVLPEHPIPKEELDDTPVLAEPPMSVTVPLKGAVTAAFSMEELAYNPLFGDWRTHNGVDIAAEEGTEVLAACAGEVEQVTEDRMMGVSVVLRHENGFETTYACLKSDPLVERGDRVAAGQVLGSVGSGYLAEADQGPHLHFSVTRDAQAVDPGDFLGSIG